MTEVRLFKLDELRNGERRIPYKSLIQMADQINTSPYVLPGPKGYLSPSTITKWITCPQEIYLAQILGLVPKQTGLAALFGSAQHEAMAKVFERYKAGEDTGYGEMMSVAEGYISDQLKNLIPTEFFSGADTYLEYCKTTFPGSYRLIEEGINSFLDYGLMPLDATVAILSTFKDPSGFNEKYPLAEVKRGKTIQELLDGIAKRRDDMGAILERYAEGKMYKQFGLPSDIISVEEDMFVTINGIPIYFIADLVTTGGVFDHKFTSSSMVEKKRAGIPFDFQLWLYEVVYDRPAELLLYTPPAKTSRAKPRDLIIRMGRRDEGQRVLEDADFVSYIERISYDINEGYFEKRGQSFLGGCGNCEAFEVCTKVRAEIPEEESVRVGKVANLKPRAKFDPKEAKERLMKESIAETGELLVEEE